MKNRATSYIVLLMVAFGGSTASAESPRTAFTGGWLHSGQDKDKEEKQRLKAIQQMTSKMSVFMRGIARKRLAKRTAPPRELRLSVDGDRFELSASGHKIALRLGAKPVAFERDGKRGKLSARRDGARIVVVASSDKGKRATTYALSADGRRLTVSVVMSGKRLPKPLAYRSTYRRR
jgi:hypothetical protein